MQQITNIKDYQERVRELLFVPTSFRRDSIGYPGEANKLFQTFLFCDRNIDIQFLKDVGLIRMFATRCKATWCLNSLNFLPSPHPLTGPPAHHLSPLRPRGAVSSRYSGTRAPFTVSTLPPLPRKALRLGLLVSFFFQ